MTQGRTEFEQILEELGYELTSARSVGLDDPEQLRKTVKRMRDLVANAETLVSRVGAEKLKAEGFSGRAYDEG